MLDVFLSGKVSLKRFGYLDRDSNFALVYEAGESDKTLFPGRYYKHNE